MEARLARHQRMPRAISRGSSRSVIQHSKTRARARARVNMPPIAVLTRVVILRYQHYIMQLMHSRRNMHWSGNVWQHAASTGSTWIHCPKRTRRHAVHATALLHLCLQQVQHQAPIPTAAAADCSHGCRSSLYAAEISGMQHAMDVKHMTPTVSVSILHVDMHFACQAMGCMRPHIS
jgi:hypothetical protein